MGGGSPRFRRDMQAANVEDEGVLFVEVTDPRSGKSFRFYDFEHTVALALDGRPLEVVAATLKEAAELELTRDQIASFADQLQALGFLENGENGPAADDSDLFSQGSLAELEADSPEFFPPLVAEESGSFERPRGLGEEPAEADIFGDAAGASDDAVTPPPEPLPTPVPRPTEPVYPTVEPMVRSRFAQSASAPVITPAPATRGQTGAGERTMASSAGSAQNSNGARAASDIQSPIPDAADRNWTTPPLEGLATPTPTPAAGRPDPGDLPTPSLGPPEPGGAQGRPLRLVPTSPFPLATESPPWKAEPEREREPEPELQTNAQTRMNEIENRPIVLGTGSPSFPPPAEEQESEEGQPQRLELSGSRRFLTPERTRPSTTTRPVLLAYAALGLAAAVIVAIMVYRYLAADEPAPVSVRVVVPSPSSVYRWWDATTTVQQSGSMPLALPRDGQLAEIVPAGTRFAAGDVLALLESGKPFRNVISHNKSRLAYYEQKRETMIQKENRAKLREAEIKIAEKKRLISEAQQSFAAHALLAAQPGEVAATLVSRGATVKAGDPVLRLKSSGYRAVFELSRADADRARQLGFCRVEVEGKPLECSLAAEGGDETHVAIELPDDPTLTGKTARLARDRLDAVFSVPLSALVRVGESDRLFVVAPSLRAEMRVVAVADRSPTGATITQGLDVGDRVIVDVPQGLRPDARLLISSTTKN
jgi:multidrug efflux pump subunit AcrA (membrane-fusion protein)